MQAYRKGELIGNFVRITDELGEDFFADEVERFLKDFGILPDLDSQCDASEFVQSDGSDFDLD